MDCIAKRLMAGHFVRKGLFLIEVSFGIMEEEQLAERPERVKRSSLDGKDYNDMQHVF